MFHLKSLELLHWDYCQRLTLPLDGAIITVAGPNGSGKTTLLDAMRTLLGLECSGGRSYKTYARHANADSVWLRATVDNHPRTRQSSSRPFARSLLYADEVTLACHIARNGGDWQRRYWMGDGDVPIEALLQRPEREWLGLEAWRRRLESAGLSRAIARVLALEQGQTDRLCEYSPRELLRLVFDVFGDQEVLDRYEEARRHQQAVAAELEAAQRELAHGQAQLAELASRVNLYRQWQARVRERDALQHDIIPALQWHGARRDAAQRLWQAHRQRQRLAPLALRLAAQRQALAALHERWQQARQVLHGSDQAYQAARDDAERLGRQRDVLHDTLQQQARLQALAAIDTDHGELQRRLDALVAQAQPLQARLAALQQERHQLSTERDQLSDGRRAPPPPPEVEAFLRELRRANIGHHVVADVIDIADERWRAAAEGVLRGLRWVVVLDHADTQAEAMALAERLRYRHYVVPHGDAVPADVPRDSLLAVLRVRDTLPGWMIETLRRIRRVANIDEGLRLGGEWITPQAYWRDGRGGRSVWIEPREHQFGAAAVQARRQALDERLAQLDTEHARLLQRLQPLQHDIDAVQQALRGVGAAQQLAQRVAEFQQAQAALQALQPALADAQTRLAQALQQLEAARARERELDRQYHADQQQLQHDQSTLDEQTRHAMAALRRARDEAAALRRDRCPLPASWRHSAAVQPWWAQYGSAEGACNELARLQRDLDEGQWETDPSVEERHTLMQANVVQQELIARERQAGNAAAARAVDNARERYIDVLRSTVRRYRKNIVELGQLAGVEVHAELPHLDNDDTVLRQAELKVHFNFDGKGHIGLNDGEASGGQQVIKSLILLVGLLKDDETPGGFVFIDEPFAHLDVRNIQLVGHFLKSTRAQYVLTTPITHNVEVFEPADITLVTSKKPAGARWAPPIGVLQRRPA
ncbi:ATP-binding protein [Tepidimonas aquatica]|uniref:Chromosome partition protein Smc n=1 Tax=Tepidimonas aquatica TaxID=247482 RepID=A0A554WF62_9BURK|nr:ATP-binding protein [Tepidimonas aquatica]TSE22221.1 Chromosome partition protein Smc [Tepidimonas aquatica]